MIVKEKFNQKLLVEGNDDQHVIWALCEKYDIRESFDVIDCTGIDKLIEQIPVRYKSSGTKTVGIIVDADANLAGRWSTLKKELSNAGFKVPENIPHEGLIMHNDIYKAGVWIMPDNRQNGMLEDFISFLIPHDDRLLPVVDSIIEKIEADKINKYKMIHHSKASVHTWLAWQEDPGTPLGAAITKRYLTTEEVTCKRLIDWMNNLFFE